MNIIKKYVFLSVILFLSFLRTGVDVFRKLQFPTYQHVTNETQRNTYYNFVFFKRIIDVPIAVLTFIFLWKSPMDVTLYLYAFILILNLAIDYIFAITNENPTYIQIFIDKHINFWFDILLNISITYLLYRLFNKI